MSEHSLAPRTGMILAAGRGERMRPLTDAVPKPLLRIGVEPLIHHHVVALAHAGVDRIVVNLAWLGGQIREFLGDGSRYGVSITYSEERPRTLETAGGIVRALKWLSPGPFVVVNGDIYCDFPFWRLRLTASADAHIVLVPNPPQHPQGDFGFDGRRATENAASGPSFTFAGIAIYREAFFDGCVDGPAPLKPLLLRSIQCQRCTAEVHEGLWEDVGTPERWQRLNEIVAKR